MQGAPVAGYRAIFAAIGRYVTSRAECVAAPACDPAVNLLIGENGPRQLGEAARYLLSKISQGTGLLSK
jgi:hypothetical protein